MNLKINHLQRALPPHLTRQFAFDFDKLIMRSHGQLLHFEPQIQTICKTPEAAFNGNKKLTIDMHTSLAQHLIRHPEAWGRLSILPMTQVVEPAFYAATVRFLQLFSSPAETSSLFVAV